MPENSTQKRILLAAGGTGGHVFPAIAVAEHLSTYYDVSLITDPRGVRYLNTDHREVFKHIHILPITHFSGSLMAKFLAPLRFVWAGCATPFLMRPRPDGVLGFGGFTAFWPMVWARLFKSPTLLYQTDAVMGQTNRALKRFATQIATGFKKTQNLDRPATHVGLVTRPGFSYAPYKTPPKNGAFRLLILGGSQGASSFSRVIPEAIRLLPAPLRQRLHITQQCRDEDLTHAHQAYGKSVNVTLVPFIQDIARALADAHLVITRAGTSTIGELAAMGRPALFVPYPHAKDNHQYLNAQTICRQGGGFVLTQNQFTPKRLTRFLKNVITHPDSLVSKAQAIHHAFPQSAMSTIHHLVDTLLRTP